MILLTTTYELHESSREGILVTDSPSKLVTRLIEIVFVSSDNYIRQTGRLNSSTRLDKSRTVDGWNIINYDLFDTEEDCQTYLTLVSEVTAENTELRGYEVSSSSQVISTISIEEWDAISENTVMPEIRNDA
jgi:hypothetical protein